MDEKKITTAELDLLKEVRPETLMEYDKGIAAYIRNSGTEEELKAFHFIADCLEKSGIPMELTFSDGYISLPLSASLMVNGTPYDCLTHSMSVSVTDLQGELLYAGKGKKADFAKLDAAGRIVVIEGLAMGSAVKLAEKAGAAGAVFLNDQYIHNMIGSNIWGSPSIENLEQLPKIPFLSVNSVSADAIRQAMKKGPAKAVMTTKVDTRWRKLPTLTGEVKGSRDPDKFLLLSCHVDSWLYGAMDNGTANAALMHVAAILNQHKDQLKRSLRICFWSGHSHGRYAGSTWYCDSHFEDLWENCFLHINADSLGGRSADILTEANAMAETKSLAAPVIQEIAGQSFHGSRYGRAGDQSFWGTGTPSLFMGLSEQPLGEGTAARSFAELMGNGKTGGFGWWWHSSEDTVDKIDPATLTRDCKVYLLTVYRACSSDFIPVDEHQAARDILSILQRYQKEAGDKADLGLLLKRAEKLVSLTRAVNEHKAILGSRKFNEYVMAMSRILVPLNYVEGSLFEHDAAVRGNDMPLLTVLDRFADVEKGSDEWKLITVAAVRRINAAAFALKKAIALAGQYLEQ